jgi:hypothetical protein
MIFNIITVQCFVVLKMKEEYMKFLACLFCSLFVMPWAISSPPMDDTSAFADGFGSVLEAGATPFALAHKYRFAACNARSGAIARASWILDVALEAGEIDEEQYEDEVFRNDVRRFIRGLCSNRR